MSEPATKKTDILDVLAVFSERIDELESQLEYANQRLTQVQKENARLRAELAERDAWEAVPDGVYGVEGGPRVVVHGRLLEIINKEHNDADGADIKCSVIFNGEYDFVLMRRREGGQDG